MQYGALRLRVSLSLSSYDLYLPVQPGQQTMTCLKNTLKSLWDSLFYKPVQGQKRVNIFAEGLLMGSDVFRKCSVCSR